MDYILVTRPALPPLNEYVEEIRTIWENRWLTNSGPLHQELNQKLAAYLGVENLALFANGHTALELGIGALELQGEVITTPYTFASTIHAILRNGLTPVFCDIDPETLTIDANKIEALITERTCAVLGVHVYGTPCDIDKIDKIAGKHGLKVIYDAAHCFGERLHGAGIGQFGDISMFSLHATKAFHTVEGGALCAGDAALTAKVDRIKNFGFSSEEEAEDVGTNAKMSEFHAAMGLCNLRHIDDYLENRRRIAERYTERLRGIDGIGLLPEIPGLTRNYIYYPILLKKPYRLSRDELKDCLAEQGVLTRKYFYPLVSRFACMKGIDPGDTPVAEAAADSVLCLPMYDTLELEDVDRICDCIIKHGF